MGSGEVKFRQVFFFPLVGGPQGEGDGLELEKEGGFVRDNLAALSICIHVHVVRQIVCCGHVRHLRSCPNDMAKARINAQVYGIVATANSNRPSGLFPAIAK
jgi:hypothetical protein